MKKLLQAEELALFVACLFYFPAFQFSWWWFAACILLPDLSMVGYLVNSRVGAICYNIFHHRGIAILVFAAGVLWSSVALQFLGFILFSHATMDRIFGYGLKYEKGFRFTHLGIIGNDPVSGTTPG
jgi:hypothetical protein